MALTRTKTKNSVETFSRINTLRRRTCRLSYTLFSYRCNQCSARGRQRRAVDPNTVPPTKTAFRCLAVHATKRFAKDGRPYYVDNSNHTTQWDHPVPFPGSWTHHQGGGFPSEAGSSGVSSSEGDSFAFCHSTVGFVRRQTASLGSPSGRQYLPHKHRILSIFQRIRKIRLRCVALDTLDSRPY